MNDGNIITDPNEIADDFNEYFIKVGPNLAEKIPPSNVNFSSYLFIYLLFLDQLRKMKSR